MHMHSARAAHVHYAPHHEMTCTFEIRSLNSIRPVQNHYDFELEAGIAKHCLGVKIVYIGIIKSKSYFQEKVPYQIAPASFGSGVPPV